LAAEPPVPQLAHLCRVTVELAAPLELGATPLGERRIIPIIGGHFNGERLNGEVLPGGADWQLVRRDGAALLDARYTLRTTDGALIYVSNQGIRIGSPETLARLRRGEEIDPTTYYFRTVPTFETGATHYAWLNDLIAVCSGMRAASAVILDFYAVN
jgi:hypothetical protein